MTKTYAIADLHGRVSIDANAIFKAADMPAPRIGDWMQTFTGTGIGDAFWPLDPVPWQIPIRGIAHSLSMLCRYNGHCIRFLSVGEHSVHIARWIRANGGTPDETLWGLLHDAPEGLGISDVIRPVKPFVPGLKAIEGGVMDAVRACFGLSDTEPAIVKEADNRILNDEQAQNMEVAPMPWTMPDLRPLGITLRFWSPAEAEAAFLDMFDEINKRRL